jgi:ABC-type transport system involved in multi-copper enzyme maturation permease subunit
MIWLSWRQFRVQAIVAGCVLAGLAIVLLSTGFTLASLYDSSNLPGCPNPHACAQALASFTGELRGSIYQFVFYFCIVLIYLTPALIGAFWGAPLVAREAETGTLRLAWSQSVSRSRWLLVKVAMLGLAAMAVAGLMSLMLYLWSEPAYKAAKYASVNGPSGLSIARLSPLLFGTNGSAPIGYAAFAFAVGLAAGVLIKRTLPAMAVTLAVLAFVLVAWPAWVRPHLIPPVHSTVPLRGSAVSGLGINSHVMTIFVGADKPGAWVISDQAVDAAGQQYAGPPPRACLSESFNGCASAIVALHLRQAISFDPATRYWALQGSETGAYLLLAVALAGAGTWSIRRRRLA